MTSPPPYRYWAFISYSNKDKAWARWLHKAIENYGIPARLVSHPTPTGDPAPKRLRPLFHDRAELPAAPRLGDKIEEALQASRYLIVICSPHAAQSPWVNKEVKTFIGLGRRKRVLAVIVDGEPGAGGDRECFPAALRQAEPIAADVRPEGDGKTNAKLKLLAGMLGVGFDGLKQRDIRRRIRRLQIAVGIALMLAMGFAGLALYAQHQRDKAVMARRQAESILAFLLGDLQDKLKPLGRLDILRDVQDIVDEYYLDLGVEKGAPHTLYKQSASFVNKGTRLFAEGDLEGALQDFQAGLQIIRRLAMSYPSNAFWQRNMSVSYALVGDVLFDKGDLREALEVYRKAHMILDRLVAYDLSNVDLLFDLSVSHSKIGDVLRAQGDLASALDLYLKCLSIRMELAAAAPSNAGWQWGLSETNSRIGDVLRAQGDLAGALNHYRKCSDIREGLVAADPLNTGWLHDLSVIRSKIGDVLVYQGDLDGALETAQKSLSIAERLAEADPSNASWLENLSMSHATVGDVRLAQGDIAGALEEYQKSLDIAERLAEGDPSNAGWQRHLFISYRRMASFAETAGQVDAIVWWRKAFDQLSKLNNLDLLQPAEEEYLVILREKAGL